MGTVGVGGDPVTTSNEGGKTAVAGLGLGALSQKFFKTTHTEMHLCTILEARFLIF